MPKLNLKLATAIKVAQGSVRELKGVGFAWGGEPAPQPDGPVFTDSTPNGEISNQGRTFRRSSGTGYANCKTDTPLQGLQYFEVRIVRTSAGYVGAGLYGDLDEPFDTANRYTETRWPTSAVAVQADSPWSVTLYGNYGDNTVYVSDLLLRDGDQPAEEVFAFAVNATTRAVWVREASAATWHGGGDPVAGTLPDIVLENSLPIYVAACSQDGGNTVTLLTPAEHVGTPPTGFTPYAG